ncbi:hypothetical protein GBAR_LOCUS6244 [Geodia barretti]|uniref:Uncharacterized protein n=1 Tax=Geodia barretti TaxID=519541 RepID=A0AA35RF79_GEOBA|nr:hypothetical protein GBAR_LOCUS6244 [Geodia barretti]
MSTENFVEEKMVDAAKVALWEIYGPHPGLALLKFWQGIVELCIAIVVFALSFAVLVAACVAISDVSIDTTGATEDVVDMVEDSRSATGFLIFVSLFLLLWELGLVLVRFLNFGAVNRFFFIFALVVVGVAAVLAVFSFSGGVAAAVEGEDWREQIDSWEDQGAALTGRANRIPKNMAATGACGILAGISLAVQGTWTVLFLLLHWNKNIQTTSAFAGVTKGVETEVKEAI